MDIILASASPRRRELLSQIGLQFRVVVSEVPEIITEKVPPRVVEELSAQKAKAVSDRLPDSAEMLVIGADTVVAYGGRILGKPTSMKDAVEMLSMLAGNTHEVYTGVTLIHRAAAGAAEQKTFHEVTKVTFYPMTEAQIAEYVSTGDPMDKAGAYGIQGLCARYIRGIVGDYNNVVGLPVGRLYQEAGEWLRKESGC